MRLRYISLVLAAFFALGFVAGHQGEQHAFTVDASPKARFQFKDAITPELSAFVEELIDTANVPGISLGVVRTGHGVAEVELGAWGRRTEDGNGHDIAPDTRFVLASCSKAFLASAMGILMDDYATGRNVTPLPAGLAQFDWDTKVVDVLPDEWAIMDPWANVKANIRDILGHVSGLPRHESSYGPDDTPKDVVKRLQYLRPAYELREKWSYNNMMYTVGSYIISVYSGMSFEDFVASRLFAPMNMTSTLYSPVQAANSGKLTQTWTSFGRRVPFWFTENTAHLNAGAGGVISNAEDMVKWLTVLLNHGVNPTTKQTVIPRETFDEMTTAHAIMRGGPDLKNPELSIEGYGMGWWRYSYQGHELVTHTGSLPGISTRVVFMPADGLGIVILANADDKAAANEALMYRIIEDSLGLRRIDRPVVSNKIDPLESATYEEVAPLDVDLAAYAGTYSSPGYGAFTLCAPTSDSQYCAGVLSDFGSLEPFGVPSEKPALYAAFPRIFSSHFRLTHQANSTFSLSATSLFPKGYGGNTTAFEMGDDDGGQGRADFGIEDGKVTGFALVIDFDAMRSRMRAGCSPNDAADAWFAKIV